jgi:acyl-CoA dehydrogenase
MLNLNLDITPERQQIVDAVTAICDAFDDRYWSDCERDHRFPHEFHRAMADAGWLGITMPAQFGGSELGITEAALLMQVVGNSAGVQAACTALHINIFGPQAVVVHGNEEQKARLLPGLARGDIKVCFGVTEPDAGLDTSRITTTAQRKGDGYVINGRKVWTSTAQIADKIMIIARTTPRDQCARPTDGMSLFFTDLDRTCIEVTEIEKMGRAAVDSNSVFIDELHVPEADRIGAEGDGFKILLDSLNPERILVAAEAVGMGFRALGKATSYAKERVVFDRPIGMNQSIQHPLAESWAELSAANLMVWRAAMLYDAGKPCGAEANAAKFLSADAAFLAADRAVRTHGGYGYAREYHVERYFRELVPQRMAPVSRELILCYLAERVLGLPKSY